MLMAQEDCSSLDSRIESKQEILIQAIFTL